MASADENAQLGPKWLFVPLKARNHRREKAPRLPYLWTIVLRLSTLERRL